MKPAAALERAIYLLDRELAPSNKVRANNERTPTR